VIEILSFKKNKDLASVQIPGSKYESIRVLFLAALSKKVSKIENIPLNDDILDAIRVLQELGIDIKREKNTLWITGSQGNFVPKVQEINVGLSGTLARFVVPFICLQKKPILVNAQKGLCFRPMRDLFDALVSSGVKIEHKNNCLPAKIFGRKFEKVKIKANISSQYVSGLLIMGAIWGLEIELLSNLVSSKFVDMTISLMNQFGSRVIKRENIYTVASGGYRACDYRVFSDWSSASYFLAFGAITNQSIKVENLDLQSEQGEAKFVFLLQKMGCRAVFGKDSITIYPSSGTLEGIEVDMGNMPDVVPTLAMVACFAKSKTIIKNIAHLKYKECDRLNLIEEQINNLGGNATVLDDKLIIRPAKLHSGEVNPYGDHRMAMSFALIGAMVKGIKILDESCVNKSFEYFWEEFQKLGVFLTDTKN